MGGGSSKKVTVGYKYYMGSHQALCHGPADKLLGIRVAGKIAWAGASTGGAISVNAKDLFGGEKREGGIEGTIDVCMGGPAQGQNDYLAAKLGAGLLPAFRGVMCAVLRQVYIGLNPYPKDWAWMVQRIHTRSGGATQWNDSIAQINEYSINHGVQATTKTVFVLEPNSLGWAYVEEDEPFTKTSADIPMYGANIAPFVGENSWYGMNPPSYELIMPEGRRFQPARLGRINGKTIVGDGNVNPEGPPYRKHWISFSFALVDLSPVYFHSAGGGTVYIDDVLLTTGSPLTPTKKSMKVTIVKDFPEELRNYVYLDAAAWQIVPVAGNYGEGSFSDMNPIHIIRECLTDSSWGMGYSEYDMGDSFYYAADVCYDEGMGISLLWSQQSSIEDFVMEILRHIDAALYVDRTTGLFEIKMIREDYSEYDMMVLSTANCTVESFTKTTVAELINEITVSYDSHETGQVETVTLQNLAMIQEQGAIIPATVEYMGFANQATALKVAARDLKAMSTPLASAVIVANRQAAHLNIGDVFWLSWPEYQDDPEEPGVEIETIIKYIMRVVEISLGDGVENAVRIECVQDVFSLPSFSYVVPEDPVWEEPTTYPLPASPRVVMEAPYYELVRLLGAADITTKLSGFPELGFLFAAAGRQGQELNAEINSNAGGIEYQDSDMLNFCPYASLTAELGYLDTTITIASIVDLDEEENFEDGLLAQLGTEIVVVESLVGTTATIRRGCLDTVPRKHLVTEKLVIWDGFSEGDEVEYAMGEVVNVRLRTSTGDGVLPLVVAPQDSFLMKARAIAPYPPADLKINGAYFPDTVELLTGLVLTWVHRDRVQQTAGVPLGWTAGSVGPEAGTTYSARLLRADNGAELASVSGVAGTTTTLTSTYTGEVLLEVWSVRGGWSSYQKVEHLFDHLVVKLVDDAGTTTKAATTTGNVLTNDQATGTLVVTEVRGESVFVGVATAAYDGGVFTINADGTWLFDPAGDFDYLAGTETETTSITYTASDGISSGTATLSITVTAS